MDLMLLSTSDVARRLNVAAVTVRLWANTGRLPCQTLSNGTRFFQLADVDRLAAERQATMPVR
jgi:DNA-binding transcriptional MerR regulator